MITSIMAYQIGACTQYHFLPYGVECVPQPGYILASSYDQSQAAEQAE